MDFTFGADQYLKDLVHLWVKAGRDLQASEDNAKRLHDEMVETFAACRSKVQRAYHLSQRLDTTLLAVRPPPGPRGHYDGNPPQPSGIGAQIAPLLVVLPVVGTATMRPARELVSFCSSARIAKFARRREELLDKLDLAVEIASCVRDEALNDSLLGVFKSQPMYPFPKYNGSTAFGSLVDDVESRVGQMKRHERLIETHKNHMGSVCAALQLWFEYLLEEARRKVAHAAVQASRLELGLNTTVDTRSDEGYLLLIYAVQQTMAILLETFDIASAI